MSERRVKVEFRGGEYEVYFSTSPYLRPTRVDRHGLNRKASSRDSGAKDFSITLPLTGRTALAVIQLARKQIQ